MIVLQSKLDGGLQFVFNDDGGFIGTQLRDYPRTGQWLKYLFDQGREIEALEGNSLYDFLDELDELSNAS